MRARRLVLPPLGSSVFNIVFICSLSGVLLAPTTTISIFMAVCAILACLAHAFKIRIWDLNGSSIPSRPPVIYIVPICVALLLLLLRCAFQPTCSPDAVFRWNHLAYLMMKTGGLGFYPPSNLQSFLLYPYPDGFPPFISTIYFSIYSILGKITPESTIVIIAAEYAGTIYFTFKTVERITGNGKTGYVAACILVSSGMLFFSFFIGQETGFTALATAMLLYYLLKAQQGSQTREAVMAAFAASIGSICREYGPVFILIGALLCVFQGLPKKATFTFLAVSAMCAGPFYLHNLVINGNPFYPLYLAPCLPFNRTHAGIMGEYAEFFGVGNHLMEISKASFQLFIVDAPMQAACLILALCGLGGRLPFLRKAPPRPSPDSYSSHVQLLVFAAMFTALWVYSLNYTCGGLFYSTRMLSPVIVILSILGGITLANALKSHWKSHVLNSAIVLSCLWGVANQLTLPTRIWATPPSKWLKEAFGGFYGIESRILSYVDKIPEGGMVLSDSALYQAALIQSGRKGACLVPLWTPEFEFLFDESLSFNSKILRLREFGVTHILKTRDSINNSYLDRFKFFSTYDKLFAKCVIGPDSILFELPTPAKDARKMRSYFCGRPK